MSVASMKIWLFLLSTASAFAQIERPMVGVMLDSTGGARPVFGTLASATPGDTILTGVLSMQCSASECLMKTLDQIVATSGKAADAPAGPAIFGAGYVYFPASQQLARWKEGALEPIPFTPDGEILALRPNGDGLDYAVERDGGTWIEHVDNVPRVVNILPPAHAAMLLDDAVLLALDDAVHLLQPDGVDTILPVGGVESFIAMNDRHNRTIEFVTPQGMWAFDLATHTLALLPGVAP